MTQEWRITRWLPVLTFPLGPVGLLLILGAVMSEDPWYAMVPGMVVGAVGVATATFGIVDRRRAFVRIESGRLHFRLATGGRRDVDLARLESVDVRQPRFFDRRLLLLMTRDDGSSLAFPAWAAWRHQEELLERLRLEFVQAGIPLSPLASKALGFVGA